MKRFIAAVSFAVLATPVFAQPQSLGPTSAIGPASVFEFNGGLTNPAPATAQRQQDRAQVASSGATRSDTEIGTDASGDADFFFRHVEQQPGYRDPS